MSENNINPNTSNVNPDPNVQRRYSDRVLGMSSIATGVFTIIVGFIPCVGWLCFIPGIIGLVFGIIGVVQSRKAGIKSTLSYWGIVLNILGMLGFLIPNVLMGNEDAGLPNGD